VAEKLLPLQVLILEVEEEPAGTAAEHAGKVDGAGDVGLYGNVIQLIGRHFVKVDFSVAGIQAEADDDLQCEKNQLKGRQTKMYKTKLVCTRVRKPQREKMA
jgi:hypothetical protein